mmetsp:Transcript_67421/g.175527  ORF Transcript_67421/g.175527 Transcript_67421/m.175527 type:complete len:338 (+) Transcript_67421:152-1165(+)
MMRSLMRRGDSRATFPDDSRTSNVHAPNCRIACCTDPVQGCDAQTVQMHAFLAARRRKRPTALQGAPLWEALARQNPTTRTRCQPAHVGITRPRKTTGTTAPSDKDRAYPKRCIGGRYCESHLLPAEALIGNLERDAVARGLRDEGPTRSRRHIEAALIVMLRAQEYLGQQRPVAGWLKCDLKEGRRGVEAVGAQGAGDGPGVRPSKRSDVCGLLFCAAPLDLAEVPEGPAGGRLHGLEVLQHEAHLREARRHGVHRAKLGDEARGPQASQVLLPLLHLALVVVVAELDLGRGGRPRAIGANHAVHVVSHASPRQEAPLVSDSPHEPVVDFGRCVED